MLFFGGRMLLRLVATLAFLIVLVVITLLVCATMADAEFASTFVLRREPLVALHLVSRSALAVSATLLFGVMAMVAVRLTAAARDFAVASSIVVRGRFLNVQWLFRVFVSGAWAALTDRIRRFG
jgi:hypothetical protein